MNRNAKLVSATPSNFVGQHGGKVMQSWTRLVVYCALAVVVVTGTGAVSNAQNSSSPPGLIQLPAPFDAGEAAGAVGNATAAENAAAPPFVGLATRIAVDPLFGTAKASIPIELPPARLTPDVTVHYSSNGASAATIFGAGWDVSLGSITRNSATGVPLNPDGTGNYNNSVGFVLNLSGQSIKLDTCVSLDCSYWAASAEETWLTAQFNGTANTWQVTDKAGTVYTFGGTQGARTGRDITNFTTTYAWFLTSVTDTSNNTMQILYQAASPPADPASHRSFPNSNTHAYPDEIDYGGNSANGGSYNNIFHVKFGYQTRPDTRLSYRNGFPEQLVQRVASLTVWADFRSTGPTPTPGTTQTNFTRQYTFSYQQSPDNGVSLLTQVAEGVASGTATPPATTFTYSFQTGTHGLSATPTPLSFSHTPAYASSAMELPPFGMRQFIDVDGDGLPDLVDAAATGKTNTRTDVYPNLGGGNFGYVSQWNASQVTLTTPLETSRVLDLDGDALPDWVVSSPSTCPTPCTNCGPPPSTPSCAWNVYHNTNGSLATAASTMPGVPSDLEERLPNPSYNFWWARHTAELTDLDGDGLPDILDCNSCGFSNGPCNCDFYRNTGSGSGFVKQAASWFVPVEPWSDVSSLPPSDQSVQWLSAGWTPLVRTLSIPQGDSWTLRQVVDLNGDGLPDYVNIPTNSSGTSWQVYFNTGQGFLPAPFSWPVPAGAPISFVGETLAFETLPQGQT